MLYEYLRVTKALGDTETIEGIRIYADGGFEFVFLVRQNAYMHC